MPFMFTYKSDQFFVHLAIVRKIDWGTAEARPDGSRRAAVTTSGTVGHYGNAMHRVYITAIRYAEGTVRTFAATQCGLAPVQMVPDSVRLANHALSTAVGATNSDPPFAAIPWPRCRASHRDDDALDFGTGGEFLELPLKIR